MSSCTKAAKVTCGFICIGISLPFWFLIGYLMSQPYSRLNHRISQLFLFPALGLFYGGGLLICGDSDDKEGDEEETTPALEFRSHKV